jgi:GNAT superfamily N-acetyltransferase
MGVEFFPLTPERWSDFETLFGKTGGTGGCWCMYWRLPNKDYEANKGAGNRVKMQTLVNSGEVTGIIAYVDGKPAGWCSIAPRERFPRLLTSRVFKALDDQPVWTVVCFFIAKGFRRQNLSTKLLQAAIDYAKQHGAQIIEACPVEPQQNTMPEVFAWTGMASTFQKVGFVEVARRSDTRPLMRYYIK